MGFLLLALGLVACAGGPSQQQWGLAEEILQHVNAARTSGTTCGSTTRPPVPRVSLSSQLIEAAQVHSDDMMAMNELKHTGSDGSTPAQRIARTGYQAAATGENAAWNYNSEAAVVAGWLGSEPHCNSIMSGSYTEIGAARAGQYWTLVFARPRQ